MIQRVEDVDDPPAVAASGSDANRAPPSAINTVDTPSPNSKTDLPCPGAPQPNGGADVCDSEHDSHLSDRTVSPAHPLFTPPTTPKVGLRAIGEGTAGPAACAEEKRVVDATGAPEPAVARIHLPPGSYPGVDPWASLERETMKKGGKSKTKIGNPRPPLPHEPRLRFSTIELDAKYDDYPVLTRMWMSVRDADDTHEWITWHNVTVMFDFALWALPLAWAWLRNNPRALYLVGTNILRKTLIGLEDALGSWGQYALLHAIEEQRLSWSLLPMVIGNVFSSVKTILDRRFQADRDELRTLLDDASRSVLFDIHLRLSVAQGNDPVVMKLLKDTEQFAAFGFSLPKGILYNGGRTPSELLQYAGSLFKNVCRLLSQTNLIIILLFTGKAKPILACVVLLLLRKLIGGFGELTQRSRRQRLERKKIDEERQLLYDIAGSATFRQENHLFQIGRYLDPAWDKLSKRSKALSLPMQLNWRDVADAGLETLVSLGPTLMKLAIILSPSVGLRLSSIKVVDDAAVWISDTLSYSLYTERYMLERVLESGLSALAYCAAVDLIKPEENAGLVDYETRRSDLGMHIETKDLTFTYRGCSSPTLHSINLSVTPGATLAIVGFNGSGKTTLLRLLLGLMGAEGTTGDLNINGLPVEQYKPSSLFNRMSCCFQEHAKFPQSLRFNIGIGDIKRFDSDDALLAAAKMGGIDYLPEELGGFDRRLNPTDSADVDGKDEGESEKDEGAEADSSGPNQNDDKPSGNDGKDGANGDGKSNGEETDGEKKKKALAERAAASLSRGQWQRIAIGRAFLKTEIAGGVDLCVYDEPTASLDPVAEHDLMERISSLSKTSARPITTIFVSHRLASVRAADQIAFMEKGRIVELGTHAELLALQGKYYQFWELQSNAYKDGREQEANKKAEGNEKAEVSGSAGAVETPNAA